MKQRIFIAINFPERIKNKLVQYQEKWPDLPARWTKKENLHITLEFLGYLTDEELAELCQEVKEKASRIEPFSVELNRICYGPVKTQQKRENNLPPKPPKMVWAVGEKIKEIGLIPHITLARIKSWQFRQINPEEAPEIEEEINLSFEVNSIEIMESKLKKGGAEYNIIESCPLKK